MFIDNIFELIEDEIDIDSIEEYKTKYTERYTERCIDKEVREKLNEVIRAVKQLNKEIKELKESEDKQC